MPNLDRDAQPDTAVEPVLNEGVGSSSARIKGGEVRKRVLRVLAALLAIAGIVGCGYVLWVQYHVYQAQQEMQGAKVPENPAETESGELPENPIDFSALWSKNVESYAWIYIPGAQINAPVQQSAMDDAFYLTHDQERNPSPVGCAYTQLANAQDFSDPVTVIYGHDAAGVFANLHYFEDSDFFAENSEFYIYTPGHILTYTVVSAYQYDDRHILNSFDFSKRAVREEYFAYVSNPSSVLRNVREDVKLDADSKIVQLSTCMSTQPNTTQRYLVTGVLTHDQETK